MAQGQVLSAVLCLEQRMSKHTPGPWIAKPDARFNYVASIPVMQDLYRGDHVADVSVHNPMSSGAQYAPNNDTAEANAYVIAASPELFDVVQDLLNWNDHAVESDGGEWLAKVITKARAAADKAEGRQS